jgi:DNA-binding transcriptional ArsR family regulator
MAPRTERAGTATTVTRPMVRDVSGGVRRVELSFDPRTAYDFVLSLYGADEEADLLPEDRAWLQRVQEALPTDERKQLDDCFGQDKGAIFRNLPSLVLNSTDIRTAADLVAAIGGLSDDELARLFVNDQLSPHGREELTDRLLAGEAEARAEARELLDDHHWPALDDLLSDPAAKVSGMRQALDTWLPRYQEVEPRVAAMLERDVARRRNDQQEDVVGLIEATTGGLRWFPEPGVRRVIMAPTYFGRPYNYIYNGAGWRLFLYPLAEEALGPKDGSVPSESVIRLYRALGDATRMRVLRLLADRDWYLTELAQRLELSKPTMKHHLALLRAAGLVTVTDEGSMTYYSLRRERIREAGLELERFLG